MTIKQRKKMYQYVQQQLEQESKTLAPDNYREATAGFCYYIDLYCRQTNISFNPYYQGNIKANLPELWAKKPSSYYRAPHVRALGYWFSLKQSGIKKRIQILKEIISEMK